MNTWRKIVNFVPETIHRLFWKKAGSKRDAKLVKRFRMLYTGTQAELEAMVDEYRRRQIRIICLFFLIAVFLALFIGMRGNGTVQTIEIFRNSYGGGQKEESLVLGDGETITFIVGEQEYTEEELEQAFKDGFSWIRENMLLDNVSSGEVRSDLNFMTEVPGGFSAEWLSSQPEILNHEGEVFNQGWTDPESKYVEVELTLFYKEEMQSQSLYFCIREPLYTEKEKLVWKIKDMIAQKEQSTRGQESFAIPSLVAGVELSRPEVNQTYGIYLMAAALFVFLFFYRGNRMKEEGEERYRQLEEDYPVLINKIVLYLGAGINLRKTFQQIAGEYTEDIRAGRTKKRYMYEELMVMVNEMNAGTGEQNAYEAFGYRLENHAYTKLISLLVQNLQKGNDGLLKALRTEENNAFFLRIDFAKKKAEEASTKLLFPMLLMLVIVMIIIMAPALFQFGGF